MDLPIQAIRRQFRWAVSVASTASPATPATPAPRAPIAATTVSFWIDGPARRIIDERNGSFSRQVEPDRRSPAAGDRRLHRDARGLLHRPRGDSGGAERRSPTPP